MESSLGTTDLMHVCCHLYWCSQSYFFAMIRNVTSFVPFELLKITLFGSISSRSIKSNFFPVFGSILVRIYDFKLIVKRYTPKLMQNSTVQKKIIFLFYFHCRNFTIKKILVFISNVKHSHLTDNYTFFPEKFSRL